MAKGIGITKNKILSNMTKSELKKVIVRIRKKGL